MNEDDEKLRDLYNEGLGKKTSPTLSKTNEGIGDRDR